MLKQLNARNEIHCIRSERHRLAKGAKQGDITESQFRAVFFCQHHSVEVGIEGNDCRKPLGENAGQTGSPATGLDRYTLRSVGKFGNGDALPHLEENFLRVPLSAQQSLFFAPLNLGPGRELSEVLIDEFVYISVFTHSHTTP